MKLYATRTGTKRNNVMLDRFGFGRITSHIAPPGAGDLRDYGIDNGAWTAHQQHQSWNEQDWQAFVWRYGMRANFVVVPDIVMGGEASLHRSEAWLPWLMGLPVRVDLLVPVQNGMKPERLRSVVGGRVGLFVGGDSEWKDATLAAWAALARAARCRVHVGRVNTRTRLMSCQLAGVDSCDGTGASIYALHAERMGNWARQQAMVLEA